MDFIIEIWYNQDMNILRIFGEEEVTETVEKGFQEIFAEVMANPLIGSLITIVIAVVLYRVVISLLMRAAKITKMNKKQKTWFNLVKSVLRYAFIIVTALVVLQINGVDVSSLIAGVGIAGVVLGLALQDTLKDVFRGFTILSDSYFKVGDLVKYGTVEGKVLALGMSSTKIEDIATGGVVSVANRNISEIEIIPKTKAVAVSLPYELKLKESDALMSEMCEETKKLDGVKGCAYLGISEFADSAIVHKLLVTCVTPMEREKIGRDTNRVVLSVLEKHGISMPYPQMDVHQK